MGNMLDAPNVEKDSEQGEVNLGGRVMYGASGMQGYRPEMEDQHTCAVSIPGLDGHAFFAVYDGHGGDKAAILSEKALLPTIQQQAQYIAYVKAPPNQRDPKMLGEAMSAGFLQADKELRPKLSVGDTSGTTVVTTFITPTHIICANAGDSRSCYCTGKVGRRARRLSVALSR